jgi:nitric oxide reductase activation protein
LASYPQVASALAGPAGSSEGYRPFARPFGRTLTPALHQWAHAALTRSAERIRKMLAARGIRLYRSDIRARLVGNQGMLDPAGLQELLSLCAETSAEALSKARGNRIDLSAIDLPELIACADASAMPDGDTAAVSWYPEWDCHSGDYVNDYTRVRDRMFPGGQSDFYDQTLTRHRGLVKRIRTAFELIRPQGLKLYRRWIEGDEFDYRALLDFAIDRKARRTPSERLYTKRVKEERDVAALLLVDLSRSTANAVAGSRASVLDVEKEALVLFSEALETVGDRYAIAGFSGTGRLGVDYFHIKDFDEPMDSLRRDRISAVAPQRNTRMGAAIRHAATQFSQSSARVKLLIVLGDGFPNDSNYKKNYAVEDTRKAIAELRAQNVHVHAITVNIDMAGSVKLDEIYGDIHHTVIVNVSELPDKLIRIYGKLTRR